MGGILDQGFSYIGPGEFVLRLACAVLAGLVLGLDREIRHRRVGVRTYMLVSLGAAAYALVTMEIATLRDAGDVTRIMQGLVGAIGFLGAGAIIQGDSRVGGIATASSLWIAGAVGMASGLGFFIHAIAIAVIAGAILHLSSFMDNRGSSDRPDNDG